MNRHAYAAILLPMSLSLSACTTNLRGHRAELAMVLHSQVQPCYSLPGKARGKDAAIIEVRLNPDGSLSQAPKVLSPSSNPLVGRAALRAVEKCAPFKIPAEFAVLYPTWKVVHITFEAR